MEHFLNLHPPATLWDPMFSCLLTQTGNQPITRQQLKHLGTQRCGRDKLLRVQSEHLNGADRESKWLWRWWAWLFGAAGLSVSQTADQLVFSHWRDHISAIENSPPEKENKQWVSYSCVIENAFLMLLFYIAGTSKMDQIKKRANFIYGRDHIESVCKVEGEFGRWLKLEKHWVQFVKRNKLYDYQNPTECLMVLWEHGDRAVCLSVNCWILCMKAPPPARQHIWDIIYVRHD